MCVIIYQPYDNRDPLPQKCIEYCASSNPDGHGLMYTQDNKLKLKKQLGDISGFYDKYKKALSQAEGPTILHFRIGTSGSKDLANAHPHFVTPNIGLVHNGVLGAGIDNLSDTRRFIKEILKNLPDSWFENTTIMNLLQNKIRNDKMVLLRNDGYHWILNQDNGYWDKELGVWFSNYTAKGWNRPKYEPKKTGFKKDDSEYEKWWAAEPEKIKQEVLDELDWPFLYQNKIWCCDCMPDAAWIEDKVDEVSGVQECCKCKRPLYAESSLKSVYYA